MWSSISSPKGKCSLTTGTSKSGGLQKHWGSGNSLKCTTKCLRSLLTLCPFSYNFFCIWKTSPTNIFLIMLIWWRNCDTWRKTCRKKKKTPSRRTRNRFHLALKERVLKRKSLIMGGVAQNCWIMGNKSWMWLISRRKGRFLRKISNYKWGLLDRKQVWANDKCE